MKKTPEGAEIVVADDGKGIPPSEKQKIFEKGFGSHTGLGLYLAQEILSITGLSIQETGEYSHGARFAIRVPAGCSGSPPDNTGFLSRKCAYVRSEKE